jgi:hypothetical protein
VGILNRHLDETAFADLFAARLTLGSPESVRPAEAHLRACPECHTRYAEFAAWLEAIGVDARAEAEEVFSAERLANQQAQISRRLEALEHPAKVIAFPRFARPVSVQPHGRRRWIAAAAAAGLIAGVGLGQLLDFGAASRVRQSETAQRQIARSSAPESTRVAAKPASSPDSDEILLNDVELTSTQVRVPESLQYLNAITPISRDYDPR